MNKNKLRSTVVTLIVAMVLIGMTFGAMADPGNVPNPRLTVSTVDDVSVYKWLGLIGIQYPVVNTDSTDSSINENVAVQNTGFNESEDSKPLPHGLSQTQVGILSYSYESDRLKITVGEQSSSGWNYQYDLVGDPGNFVSSVYGEHYAVATDTWGSVITSSNFYVDTYFNSVEAPDTATLHYDNLSLTRQVIPPVGSARSFSITFVLTNTGDSTLENVRFFQGVDYDIYDSGNDYAWYSETSDTVWQNDDNYFKNGFRGSRTASHHDCNYYGYMWSDMHSGTLNDLTKYPESGTADCGIALQWDVGDLAPHDSWDLTITFYFGEAAGIEANAGPDQNAGRSQPVTFDASGSSSVGNIATYEWDFDNDSIYEVSVFTPVYVYEGWTELGEYTVGLQVTDDEGRNDIDTVKITVVPNVDLTVSTVAFTPTEINDGDTVIFNATVENIGTEDLTDDFYVRFGIDDGYIGRQRVSGGIPAGDSVHVLQNWGADAGTHNVSVYADSGYYSSENNLIPEANETNNKLSQALPEILFPDLTITNLVWSPTDGIGDGDTVTFTITVENIGTGNTSSELYVGLEIDGNYIGSRQVSGLSAGNSTEVAYIWDADAGTHTVKAVVDYYSEITESNETNNERSQALPEIPFPDLTVTNLVWSPATDIAHGDTVTFTATVENIGANTSSSIYVRFEIDNCYIGHRAISGLTAGKSTEASLSWHADAGTHNVKAVVDYYDEISESIETNNELVKSLPEILSPDLTVTDIEWIPTAIKDSDTITFNATVNNDEGSTSRDFYVRFEVDGEYIGRKLISGLSAGANTIVTQNWIAYAGSHNVTVYVDEYDAITESDETNNKMSEDLPFISFPDLTVTNISWMPTNIVGGDTVTFTTTIENIGAGNTSRDFYVRFEVDSKYIGRAKVSDGLDSGNSIDVTQTWTATWANTVNVSVDEYDAVAESNETNNTMSKALPGLPFPDLNVTNLTWDPKENVGAGDPITFTATIENMGGTFYSTMSNPLKIAFLVNDEYVGCRNIVGGIRVGQPLTTTFTWTAQPETNPTVCVKVDYSDIIPESNEDNNELCETLTLAIKSPDLAITQLTFEPTGSIHVGDTVKFTAKVVNIGEGNYSGDFDVGFYVDDTFAGASQVFSGILAGENTFSTFNWTASSCSNPVIKAKTDFFDVVRESDENNNERTEVLPASIPYADLEITDINWTPCENIEDRDPVVFNVTVKNNGPEDVVTDFNVYFDIDGYFTRTNLISGGLAADESKTISFTWKATPGEGHTATAKADPDNVVPESDKTNNERIQPLPFDVSLVEIFEVRVEPAETTTGIGGQTSCKIKINNHGSASSNFDISVAGLDQSWHILSETSIFLSAGEEGIVDLDISVPDACENSGTFPFPVSVTSQETGITKEGSATLIVEPAPVIYDLLPQDRASLGSDGITFSWNTYINATTTLYLKAEDEVDYTPYTGAAGQIHTAVVSNLARNKNYSYYAESTSSCGSSTSPVRTFYIGNGVSFTKDVYEFTVERDYDQQVTIRVQNTDNEYHELLVEVPITYEELVLGFVGAGSQDNIIPLNPGESKDVTLAIQCADTMEEDYELIANLTSTKGDEILTDTARIKLHVHVPCIDYDLEEIGVDPVTLTKTFKLTNKGDPIADLTISVADSLKENVYIEPVIDHFRLSEGASIEFNVVPLLSSPDFQAASEVASALAGVEAASSPAGVSGDIVINRGGVTVTETLSFSVPVNKGVYEVEIPNVIFRKHIETWFCNNRPQVRIWWDMITGIKKDKIILDPLIIKFNSGGNVQPHDVYISINGHEVGSLINTIPNGYYKFNVDPSFLIYPERGVSRNCIEIHTVHQNGGHYVVGSDMEVHLDLRDYTTHLVASSQEEANQIALDNLPPGLYKAPDSIILGGGTVSQLEESTLLTSSTTEVLLGKPTTLQATSSPNLVVWAEFDNGDGAVYLAEVGSGMYWGTWTPTNYPEPDGMCVITIKAKGPGDGDLIQGQIQNTVKIIKATKLDIEIIEPEDGKKIQIEHSQMQPVRVTVTDDTGSQINPSDLKILGRVVITKADKTTTTQTLSNWVSEGNGNFRCDWTPESSGDYEITVYAQDLSPLKRESAKASVTGTLEDAELKITVSGGLSGTIDPYEKYYNPRKVYSGRYGKYIHATWVGGLYDNGANVLDFPVTLKVNKEAFGYLYLWKDVSWGMDEQIDMESFLADPGSPATYNINIKKLDPGEYYLVVKADAVNVPRIDWVEDESIRFTIERKPIFFPGHRTSTGRWIWQATAMPEGPRISDAVSEGVKIIGGAFISVIGGPVTGAIWTLSGYVSTASLDNYYVIVEWTYTPFEWDEVRKNYVQRSTEWNVAEGSTLRYQRHLRYSAQRSTVKIEKTAYEGSKWVLTAKDILVEYAKYDKSTYGTAVKYFVIALDTAITGNGGLATITEYKFAETKWWGVPDVGLKGGFTGYNKFGPRPPLSDLSAVLQPGAKEHGYWRNRADILPPQTISMQVTASTVTSDLLPVSIDSGAELITFGIRWDTDSDYSLDLSLQAPNGAIIGPSSAALNENISHTRFATDYIYDLYAIRNPQPGEWTLEIVPTNVSIEDADYFVTAIAKTDLICSFFTNKEVYSPGENITLRLYLIDRDEPITNATVQVNIYPPDGSTPDSIALYDDGNHDDGLANDGTYGNTYTSATMEGSYYISGVANGTTSIGEPFSRGFAYEVFMQDNPFVYIDSLEEGMVVQGTINIEVSAEDNSGTISSYEIWIDDVKVSDTNLYVWNTVSANGLHTITAKASDAEGNTGMTRVNLTVLNPPETGDVTPPSAPVGLSARVEEVGNTLTLSWNPNAESDLAGYNVYRSMTSGGSYAKINVDPVTDATYKDDGFQGEGLEGGREYYYVISAIDTSWLESEYSLEVNETPLSSWIDYFNDKTGIDVSASSNITVANGMVFLSDGNTSGYIISKPIHPTSILSWGYIFWLEDQNDQNTMMELSQDGINWQTVVNGADISSLNPLLPLYYKYTMLSDGTTTPVLYVLRVSYATIANPVGFSDVYADCGLDSDMDGFFDYLVINAGIDVGISGNYYLKGALKGGSDDSVLIHFDSSYYISEADSTVQLLFNGETIYQHGVNGPYILANLELLDANHNQIDSRVEAYTTSTYNYTDFERSPAEFNDNYFDRGTDTDGDGLYNILTVNTGINVTTAGNYMVIGTLEDNAGYEIVEASNSSQLEAGSHTMSLEFSGVSIRKQGADGPYYLRNLTLFYQSEASRQIGYRSEAYTTSAYNYTDFQKPSVAFTGNFSDYGTDTDTDGKYDYLTIDIEADVENEGQYSISGRLEDVNGSEIVIATSTVNIAGKQTVQLNFNGLLISGHRMNGPYKIKDLLIYSVEDGSLFDFLSDAYTTTSEYNYSDFQTPPLDLTLSPTDITFSNDVPIIGEQITIAATVHNDGTVDANGVVVQFFDGNPDAGGVQIGADQTISSIAHESTGTAQVTWTAIPGTHGIFVRVDPFDSIQENNEENNIAFNIILLGSKGDLNNDGTLTTADAAIALQMAVGARTPTTAADVSGDGIVTSLDALMILQAATGSITL